MADRFLLWLGAEMVTAGVAAEMVAGAERCGRRQSARLRQQRNNFVGVGETD